MIFICIPIFVILCVNFVSLISLIEPLSLLLHKACLSRVQVMGGEWTMIYSALICGESLPEGKVKQAFVSAGVIHLMVISGSHLIFIEKLWKRLPLFPFKNILLFFFLILYAGSSGLKPPVLRALFSLTLFYISKRLKLFWSPYWRVQLSGLLCLVCQNSLFNSLSLQLSWIASMGMCRRDISRIKSCVITYILILPIISQWGGGHPLSILVNWLIAPLMVGLLLPLSMLTVICPFLQRFTDGVWSPFIYLLNVFKPLMENNSVFWLPTLSSFQIWIYICFIFILFQTYFVYSRQKKQ